MADIKTILRELSVILGYILAKYKLTFSEDNIDIKKYLEFIRIYCKNINEYNSEVQKIEALNDLVIHKDIIGNGLRLGKLLYDKLKLDGDIIWTGAKVKSKYPFDIKIGETGISLKEDSFILKNPSFADYLNSMVQPNKPFKNVHVFRYFAPKEFNEWFDYTYYKLIEDSKKYEVNEKIFEYKKCNTYILKGSTGLVFGNEATKIEIKYKEYLTEEALNKRLGGYILEHTLAKWIKKKLEKKDDKYELLKKACSLKAGNNLKEFINSNLNIDSRKILELFQIYEKPYYYGKSFGGTFLYLVPSYSECQIKLVEVKIEVPKSQLNVYFNFEVKNLNGKHNINFRVECRYSHGQFKGIPEAKLYYTDHVNHLNNLYKSIQ